MISAYAGFALAVAANIDYLFRLIVRRPPYSTRNHDIVTLLGAGVAVASVALAGGEPLWPAVAAGVAAVQWFAITRLGLHLPPEAMRVRRGDALPPFTVRRTDGTAFSSADLAAAAPAVLVLYRGKW